MIHNHHELLHILQKHCSFNAVARLQKHNEICRWRAPAVRFAFDIRRGELGDRVLS
ncbi:protein of unknown function [Bradyrhizobium vignae]|uniref:Uncharacterized protein n=1 Tax=Bradyrhizobium vignae TaxID=1549949 RepID=A0A2U3PU87_9BRAD|nr:protein of unknown function [Bradyrhizobium vignae]